jgi:hypothetical protein
MPNFEIIHEGAITRILKDGKEIPNGRKVVFTQEVGYLPVLELTLNEAADIKSKVILNLKKEGKKQ